MVKRAGGRKFQIGRAAAGAASPNGKPRNVRVYELAREAGLPVRDVLDGLAGLGVPASTHASSVRPEEADRFRASVKGRRPAVRHRRSGDVGLIRRMILASGRYWPLVVANFLISLLAIPLALLVPVPLKIAIDSVIGPHPLPGFVDAILPDAVERSDAALMAVVAFMLVAVAVATQLHAVVNSLLATYTGERIVLDLRSKLFRHAQRLSLAYHDARGSADSTYRIQYDVLGLQSLTLGAVTSIVTSVLTIVGMLVITARLDPQIALIALAIIPLLVLVSQVYRRRLRTRAREVKELESSQLSIVQEVLGALRVVKAFGQEDREHGRFVSRSREGLRARIRLEFASGSFGLVLGVITAVGTAAVLYTGVRHHQTGALKLGELTLIMTYLSQLYSPLKSISKKAASLQGSLAGAERVFGLLDQAPDVLERTHARHLVRSNGDIRIEDVHFSYDERQEVLRGISVEVPAGTRVGIAGRTGAGKTTLLNLLMRFYDPDKGRIFLDGVDVRNYKLKDLRDQFGVVLQEPLLFATSIGENIAYARPEAEFDEIVSAANAANAHAFITGLPDGYDTVVGERGMRLSGGERQRVSLARAFLKDAPILVLDEPTSSVDVHTEAVIMEAMDRLMEGRTTFLIAHRLSTLERCDVVLQIDNGRLLAVTIPSVTGKVEFLPGVGLDGPEASGSADGPSPATGRRRPSGGKRSLRPVRAPR